MVWGSGFGFTTGALLALGYDGERQARAVYGAGIGAVAGSLVGLTIGWLDGESDDTSRLAAALIGAAAGAVAGGVYGAVTGGHLDDPEAQLHRSTPLFVVSVPF